MRLVIAQRHPSIRCDTATRGRVAVYDSYPPGKVREHLLLFEFQVDISPAVTEEKP